MRHEQPADLGVEGLSHGAHQERVAAGARQRRAGPIATHFPEPLRVALARLLYHIIVYGIILITGCYHVVS